MKYTTKIDLKFKPIAIETGIISPVEQFTNIRDKVIKQQLQEVEDALEDYILYAYGKTSEDIKRVQKNVHNFKLKGFEKVEQPRDSARGFAECTYYYDNGVCFLSVVRGVNFNFEVNRVWEMEDWL